MKIHFAALSHPGRKRDRNEDSFLTLPDLGLFLVADGMGGHNAGDVASKMVVETIQNEARKLPPLEDKRPWWKRLFFRSKPTFNPVEWLHQTIELANARIHKQSKQLKSQKGMGSTVALILKRDEALLTAHVGDSRVYRLRNNKLDQLTQDHSLAQELVRQGVMTEEEALYSAPSNVLTRALGVKEKTSEDIIYHSVESGDLYLLCSDGLYNMVEEDKLVNYLRQEGSLEEKAKLLVKAANQAGGTDNITVVLAGFN